MRYFEILIVSVVTICYQCLQTVSAVGGPPSPGALWAIAPPSSAIVTRRRLFADATEQATEQANVKTLTSLPKVIWEQGRVAAAVPGAGWHK